MRWAHCSLHALFGNYPSASVHAVTPIATRGYKCLMLYVNQFGCSVASCNISFIIIGYCIIDDSKQVDRAPPGYFFLSACPVSA